MIKQPLGGAAMERHLFATVLVILVNVLWADRAVRADLVQSITPGMGITMLTSDVVGTVPAENELTTDDPLVVDSDSILRGLSREREASVKADREHENLQLALEARTDVEVNLFIRQSFLPLVDAPESDGGIFSNIMLRALQNAGYEPLLDVSGKEGDGENLRGVSFPYPRDSAKEAGYLYSVPVMSMQALAFVRKDAEADITSIADLAGLTVCSNDVMLEQALHAADEAEVAEIEGISKQIAACFNDLLEGNLDVMLVEPKLGASITGQYDIGHLLTISDRPINLGNLHAVMPRFSPYSSAMMYHLNNALMNMIQSGELDTIISESRTANSSIEDWPPLELSPVPAIAPNKRGKSRSKPLKGATM